MWLKILAYLMLNIYIYIYIYTHTFVDIDIWDNIYICIDYKYTYI